MFWLLFCYHSEKYFTEARYCHRAYEELQPAPLNVQIIYPCNILYDLDSLTFVPSPYVSLDQSVFWAYLPKCLEIFLLNAQEFTVFSCNNSSMTRGVIQDRFSKRCPYSQGAYCHSILWSRVKETGTQPLDVKGCRNHCLAKDTLSSVGNNA